MNIGLSLKIAVARKGVTQTQVARAMGTTNQYISAIANRKTAGMGIVQRLAEYFDMPVSEFIKLGE